MTHDWFRKKLLVSARRKESEGEKRELKNEKKSRKLTCYNKIKQLYSIVSNHSKY